MANSRMRWTGIFLLGAALAGSPSGMAQKTPPPAAETTRAERVFCEEKLGGEIFSRTELYFGLSRASGSDISDAEFQEFLDTVVTPRFPDGLTLIQATGQFRGSSGVVIQEPARVLILFYPWNNARHRSIDRIRSIYKQTFQQEAVLRVDDESCVSF